jgi:hypothetical protein
MMSHAIHSTAPLSTTTPRTTPTFLCLSVMAIESLSFCASRQPTCTESKSIATVDSQHYDLYFDNNQNTF